MSTRRLTGYTKTAVVWSIEGVVGFVGGYYALGLAYDRGLMAEIEKISRRILKPKVGILGLGVAMARVQWYAACVIQVTASIICMALFRLAVKILKYVYEEFIRGWFEKRNG